MRLIFIYNADKGLWNDFKSAFRKVVSGSSACSLCSITHGIAFERSEWKKFRESLETEPGFFHRDDLPQELSDFVRRHNLDLPVILVENCGEFSVSLSREQIDHCDQNPECMIAQLQMGKPLKSVG
jgi:hypothetical protein